MECTDLAPAYINLGSVLHALGRLEESVACFAQAFEIDPFQADAHNNLSNSVMRLNWFE